MNKDRVLFAIPLYSQTEESYRVKWERKFRKNFSLNHNDRSDKEIQEFRSLQLAIDPIFYRYNNILGYAELELDYKDIFIYYHMNGDLRRKFNENIKQFRGTKSKIYQAPSYIYGSSFRNIDNRSIRKAVIASLKEIEKECKEWNVIVNIEPYMEKIQYFNFRKYFKDMDWL